MNFTDFSELLFHTFGRLLLHAQNKHTKFCIKFHFFLFEGLQDILYYCNKGVSQLLISETQVPYLVRKCMEPILKMSSSIKWFFKVNNRFRNQNYPVENYQIRFYLFYLCLSLHKKCPYSELFWSVFSCIQIEYGKIRRISTYSV